MPRMRTEIFGMRSSRLPAVAPGPGRVPWDTSAATPGLGQDTIVSAVSAGRVPWMIWTSAAATVAVVLGSIWDISWHISVGRDTFWTPPHLLIQLCAAIGGLTSIYLIARATFFGDARA